MIVVVTPIPTKQLLVGSTLGNEFLRQRSEICLAFIGMSAEPALSLPQYVYATYGGSEVNP